MQKDLHMGWASGVLEFLPPRHRDDILQEEMDGESVLVDPVDGSAHRLNETSRCVWEACDGRSTNRDIADALTHRYDVAFDEALDHVNQLLSLFAGLGLLRVPKGPRP